MKKFAFWALALTVVLVALPAMAQEEPMTEEEIIELVRSNIQKDKVAIIGAAMDFSAEEAGKFWPIYKGYETELTKVSDQRVALIKDFAANFESMTWDRLPSSCLIVSVFRTSTCRMRSSGRCL